MTLKRKNKLSDEEKRIFEKYIRPQITFLKKISLKVQRKFFPRRRVKTINDVETQHTLMIKLLYVLFGIMILRLIVYYLLDLYYWFYPKMDPHVVPPFIPLLRRMVN